MMVLENTYLIRIYLGVPPNIDQIEQRDLFYQIDEILSRSSYDPLFNDYIQGLLTGLQAVDTQLDSALQDSMAVKVSDLGLDYAQHYKILRSRGAELVRDLAAQLGAPIIKNKYVKKVYHSVRSA